MQNLEQPSYTLQEISKWDEAENDEKRQVILPSVQRGFVWKPNQIENLWDSLLRGFPVGAFVLSENKNKKTFNLLDGQQRASAICLGIGTKAFNTSKDNIKIFIDLKKPEEDDNRKFIFRVITKSHPWGYQRTDNTKILRSEQIKKSMEICNVDDHLKKENFEKFFPYDADLPIPFTFFIESALKNNDTEELVKKIENWGYWYLIKKGWEDEVKESKKDSEVDEKYELDSDAKIKKRINEIFIDVKAMLGNQKIPALYLDLSKVAKNQDNSEIIEEDPNDDFKEGKDEIENLFVRLNSGGTPLRGEELNYSILKSHIDPILQRKIEDACEGLFYPARFITIIYRLYQNKNQDKAKENDFISMKIKPKQFQKIMAGREESKKFEFFLTKILEGKNFDGKTLLGYADFILSYSKDNNPYGLPYLTKSRIGESAPELMFMLLYRLYSEKDIFKFETDLHRKMIGIITLFDWLGKSNRGGHSKLLSNIWPAVKSLEKEIFWSHATVQRAMMESSLIKCPTSKRLKSIRSFKPFKKTILFEHKDFVDEKIFLEKIFNEDNLILYAQREALAIWFKKEQYSLEDTNVPFDWDHISAEKFIHNKRRVAWALKNLYSTNGNFRAWPYSLNRIDQDESPTIKLNPLNNIDNSSKTSELKKWEKCLRKKITGPSSLKDELLKLSFCEKGWVDNDYKDWNLSNNWREIYGLILQRNVALCQEWYNELLIDDLLKESSETNFDMIISNKIWSKASGEFKGILNLDKDRNCFSKSIKIGGYKLYLYFAYFKTPEREYILKEGDIEFGIFEVDTNGYLSEIKIPEKSREKYNKTKNAIYGNFTLVSHDESSYIEIFKEFNKWLKRFPVKGKKGEDIRKLAKPFPESLHKKYKNKVGVINH